MQRRRSRNRSNDDEKQDAPVDPGPDVNGDVEVDPAPEVKEERAPSAAEGKRKRAKEAEDSRFETWMKLSLNQLKWWCKNVHVEFGRSKESSARKLAESTLILPDKSEVPETSDDNEPAPKVNNKKKKASSDKETTEDTLLKRIELLLTKSEPAAEATQPKEVPRLCINCNAVLLYNEAFCQHCGTACQKKSCVCGLELRPGARFCGSCGASTQNSLVNPNKGNLMDESWKKDMREGKFVDLAAVFMYGSESKQHKLEHVLPSVSSRPAPLRVESFTQWTAAFAKIIEVCQSTAPDRVQELLRYQAMIARLASKWGWDVVMEYDTLARQKKAEDPTFQLPELHNESWTLAFAKIFKSGELNLSPAKSKQHQGSSRPKQSQGTCNRFNRGKCTFQKCIFAHKCAKCNGDHSAKDCTAKPQ